jgi:hypothetical protein
MRLPTVVMALLPLLVSAEETTVTGDADPAVAGAALHAAVAEDPATGAVRVADELDLERTEITGNQELPKVLYIVPWKSSDLGELVGRPVNSLLDDVLAPVDREVFARHAEYYQDLNASPEAVEAGATQ